MDARDLRDEANRLVAQGRFQRAFEIYDELVRRSPNDAQLHIRQAELAKRLGLKHRAMCAYLAAAQRLVEQGHAARAQAAVKLARSMDPACPGLEVTAQ